MVTKVKNQGQCNACYAFAAVGAIESYQAIRGKGLNSLSEQQVVDCSRETFGNFGCIGGKVSSTFDFAKVNGIVKESEYPYKAVAQSCVNKPPGFKISGYRSIENQCEALENSLMLNPLAVVVNAANWGSYKSGIFSSCSSTNPNFTLLLVGVTENYWKLKNQWSQSWG